MSGEVLRWGDYRAMPWKNGGGTTREVATGGAADAFDWRVSVADVDAGGPFSAFPGIDRVITLVEGEGMVLTVDGALRPVDPLSPFAFSGDAVTDCVLESGAVRDMNVMTRRGRARGRVRIVTVDPSRVTESPCADGETLLVMATTEGVAVEGVSTPGVTLGRLDCVRHEGAGALALSGSGSVAEIRITRP